MLALVFGLAFSAPPIAHQGRVLDALGGAISGEFHMVFELHGHASNEDTLWTHSETINLQDGYYAVEIGDDTAQWDAVFDTAQIWLDVSAGTTQLGDRQPLVGVPFALRAVEAERLVDDPTLTGTVTVTGGTVTGLPLPTNASDAASKTYVDQEVSAATGSARDLFWWASVNLTDLAFKDQQGNEETFAIPATDTVACSSGNSFCLRNVGGSYFYLSFLVPPELVERDQDMAGGASDTHGNLMCWPTAGGDNEPGYRGFDTAVDGYATDLNGGHDHCLQSGNATAEAAGGSQCLGIKTMGLYTGSDTVYGAVCIR